MIYDPDSKWPVTIITIAVLAAILFVVAAALGIFADPAMAKATREAVVLYWAAAACASTVLTIAVRHL